MNARALKRCPAINAVCSSQYMSQHGGLSARDARCVLFIHNACGDQRIPCGRRHGQCLLPGRAGRIDGGAEQRYLITLRAHFGTEQRYFLTKGSKRTDEVGAPLRG